VSQLEESGAAAGAPAESDAPRFVVRNLVNAPFELPSLEGILILPALGETGPTQFSDEQVLIMRASLGIAIQEAEATPTAGPASVASGAELGRLRSEYAELVGKKPFHGWSTEDLQQRIDAALAG